MGDTLNLIVPAIERSSVSFICRFATRMNPGAPFLRQSNGDDRIFRDCVCILMGSESPGSISNIRSRFLVIPILGQSALASRFYGVRMNSAPIFGRLRAKLLSNTIESKDQSVSIAGLAEYGLTRLGSYSHAWFGHTVERNTRIDKCSRCIIAAVESTCWCRDRNLAGFVYQN